MSKCLKSDMEYTTLHISVDYIDALYALMGILIWFSCAFVGPSSMEAATQRAEDLEDHWPDRHHGQRQGHCRRVLGGARL